MVLTSTKQLGTGAGRCKNCCCLCVCSSFDAAEPPSSSAELVMLLWMTHEQTGALIVPFVNCLNSCRVTSFIPKASSFFCQKENTSLWSAVVLSWFCFLLFDIAAFDVWRSDRHLLRADKDHALNNGPDSSTNN